MSARDQLAAIVEKKTGCSKALARETVAAMLEAVVKTTKKESRFSLPGFGTFMVIKRAARKGVNPKTGEPLKIKARKSLRFKAAATLRDL